MPAATPIPRGPSVLTLYGAADLLTRPGCPVCRYAGEASDRYFSWFALEGHAQAMTITRLCASLGMCPRHTRGLLSQPGAARRLTAVNRYLVQAARDQFTGRAARLAGCPALTGTGAAVSGSTTSSWSPGSRRTRYGPSCAGVASPSAIPAAGRHSCAGGAPA